jgi:hemoglobin
MAIIPGMDEGASLVALCKRRRLPIGEYKRMLDDQALDRLTRRFYAVADKDPLLGPVIRAALPGDKLEAHFAVFRDFWSRFLLGTDRYAGNAFVAHQGLTLEAAHFDRWLEIFAEIAAQELPADVAAQALAQAKHMSGCLQGRPDHSHGNTTVSWPLGRAAKPPKTVG